MNSLKDSQSFSLPLGRSILIFSWAYPAMVIVRIFCSFRSASIALGYTIQFQRRPNLEASGAARVRKRNHALDFWQHTSIRVINTRPKSRSFRADAMVESLFFKCPPFPLPSYSRSNTSVDTTAGAASASPEDPRSTAGTNFLSRTSRPSEEMYLLDSSFPMRVVANAT